MTVLKDIYDRSPRPLRILYTNLYGLRNVRRRRRWDALLDAHEHTERLDRAGQVAYVAARLRRVLRHALTQVPFYAEHAALADELERRDVFEVLRELPVTNKELITADPSRFVARDAGRSVVSLTSGTTGTPFRVLMDPHTFELGDALWWRRTRWAGYRPGDWIVRLVGDPVVPLHEKDPRRPWIISWPDRRIYLSTFHLSARTAARMGALLRRRRPAYVMGYPSSLEILCSYLRDTDFRVDWPLRNVLFSSEPMHAHQERVVRSVLGAPIRGLYGSGEKVVSAAQCSEGRYHLSLVDGYVEGQFGLLDGGQPAPVTSLTNTVMPLIRYQVGDVIEVEPGGPCGCGRTLPVMSPVITKHEDWILTPSGRKVSPSAVVWAFIHQDIADIRSGQVIQEDERTIRVHVNADPDVFARHRDVLKASMDKVFFGEMDVDVVRTERIEVTKAGKSRFIVNKLTTRV